MSEAINRLRSIDSVESLSTYIIENMPDLYELYNSGWNTIYKNKDVIEEFILFKHAYIANLDFSLQQNRAFISLCLDFVERFNSQSAIPHLICIVNNHTEEIHLNKRLTAGACYIYPRPHTADDIISNFSQVCSLLQDAIDTEEDSNQKSIVTFLNYYSAAIDQLSPGYAVELKNKIDFSLRNSEYPFLNEIHGLNAINASNPKEAQEQIQASIDSILQESINKIAPSPTDDFIIENGTNYSIDIQGVPCDFRSIKRLSDNCASRKGIKGRGIEQIQTEDGLFDYMHNYGNMHYAKVKSALANPFPQEFDSQLSLIDWGCGQGLASMVFMENLGVDKIKQIILIEPSELALKRAALHCKKFAQNVPLQTICKEFDELTQSDIHLLNQGNTIHLFSNVLDMESYSVENLVTLIKSLPISHHLFVCVSPHIDDIRTNKIDTFVHLIQHEFSKFTLLNKKTNTKYNDFWNCNNIATGYSSRHGESTYCKNFSGEPCGNRWTRVLRVFQAQNV